jgi:hypothetical protein
MTQWGLDTLFNPAKRHMDEEKRRLQSTREEIGDSSGGKRIDLESGKVTIARTDVADDVDGVASPSEEPTEDASKVPSKNVKRAEPSAAQIRAAARRGRKLR